jgi:hypothetical protein
MTNLGILNQVDGSAIFNDFAVVKHNDAVVVDDRLQPVG